MSVREHYSSHSGTEVSNTSSTAWASVHTLTFTPASGADYIVFWSLELANKSNNFSDAKCLIRTGDTANVLFNVEGRLSTEYAVRSGFYKITGAGAPVTVDISIQAETSPDNICARNASLAALRLGPNDQYAESLPRNAVTSGLFSWTDLTAVTWTPDAGDYLILGSSLADNYAVTAPAYARLALNDVGNSDTGCFVADLTNLAPFGQVWKQTVAVGGGSRTAKWQGRAHNEGSVAGFSGNRVLVLALGDLDGHHYAETTGFLPTVAATHTDALALSGTVRAAPHLILAGWSTVASSMSFQVETAFDDGGIRRTNSARQVTSTSNSRGLGEGYFGVATYVAGPHAWALTQKGDGVATTYLRPASAFAILDLGAAADTIGSAAGVSAVSGVGASRSVLIPTPPERAIPIRSELRTLPIRSEDRILPLKGEQRRLSIQSEYRSLAVRGETRTLVVD